MGLLVPTEHFTTTLLKNSVLMQRQPIRTSMVQLPMTTNQQFPTERNAQANVAATINPLAIENGRRKISERDGTKPGAFEMVVWARCRVS